MRKARTFLSLPQPCGSVVEIINATRIDGLTMFPRRLFLEEALPMTRLTTYIVPDEHTSPRAAVAPPEAVAAAGLREQPALRNVAMVRVSRALGRAPTGDPRG